MSRSRFTIVPCLFSLLLLGAGCASTSTPASTIPEATVIDSTSMIEQPKYSSPGILAAEEIQNKQIRITTENGDIVFELFPDTAPLAVSNFVYLANAGFYNGLTFHRFVPGFVIQGGDPTGTGSGGPGYKFKDELDDEYGYDRGIVAMANSGSNTNGSQFFIMLEDTPVSPRGMQKLYTVFGRVTEGLDVVDALRAEDVMTTVVVEDMAE